VPYLGCVKDGTDPTKMSGKWEGWWKNIGKKEKYLITAEFCIINNLVVGKSGLNDGKDFEVMIGSTLGRKFEFWQKLKQTGDRFLMVCYFDPTKGICSGTWYNYAKETSGPWEMARAKGKLRILEADLLQ